VASWKDFNSTGITIDALKNTAKAKDIKMIKPTTLMIAQRSPKYPSSMMRSGSQASNSSIKKAKE